MSQQMTVSEAGRKGGTTTSARHGRKFYEAIGRKGGQANAAAHPHGHFEAIGRKGGRRMRELIDAGVAAEKRQSADD